MRLQVADLLAGTKQPCAVVSKPFRALSPPGGQTESYQGDWFGHQNTRDRGRLVASRSFRQWHEKHIGETKRIDDALAGHIGIGAGNMLAPLVAAQELTDAASNPSLA